jgi:hypothetical protein
VRDASPPRSGLFGDEATLYLLTRTSDTAIASTHQSYDPRQIDRSATNSTKPASSGGTNTQADTATQRSPIDWTDFPKNVKVERSTYETLNGSERAPSSSQPQNELSTGLSQADSLMVNWARPQRKPRLPQADTTSNSDATTQQMPPAANISPASSRSGGRPTSNTSDLDVPYNTRIQKQSSVAGAAVSQHPQADDGNASNQDMASSSSDNRASSTGASRPMSNQFDLDDWYDSWVRRQKPGARAATPDHRQAVRPGVLPDENPFD